MHTWLDFWFIVFWFCFFGFVFNNSNFLLFFFYSEFLWLVLYCFVTNVAILHDDAISAGLTFFFLGLAGVEFAVGFVLLTLFRSYKISLDDTNNFKDLTKTRKTATFFINNFRWLNNF